MAATMADLFGDSEDEDEEFMPAKRSAPQEDLDRSEGQEPSGPAAAPVGENDEDDDDDFQDQPAPRQPQQLREYSDEDEDVYVQEELQERPVGPPQAMSGALLPLPAISRLRLLQASKFLAVQTRPMTVENLLAEREEYFDEDEQAVRHRYRNQMTIRWRERTLPSGETAVESNARFVRWSNGITQLLLGDEVLDIAELDNTSANQFLFVRHSQPVPFIQGQGQLIKKLHLRPASLSSKFHRQLTADAARKHTKVNKVKATATVADPNREKAEREKAEEARIRDRETLQRKQDREMRKYPAVGRREYRPQGLTPGYLETMDEEAGNSDDEDLTATERARAALQRTARAAEEDEREAEERLAKAKRDVPRQSSRDLRDSTLKRQREADDQDNELEDEDEEEEEEIGARQPAKRGRRGLVLSDDEDE